MTLLALWLLSFAAPQPGPELSPAEVVKTVVAALQNYNSPIPNAGIFTAYQFASPANHAVTGPYGTFLGLVKAPEFAPLLHAYPLELGDLIIHDDTAEQIVTVHVGRGHDAKFKFYLSRQNKAPCNGCWMVAGVARQLHP